MTRTVKTAFGAVIAILALTVAASPASAEFHSETATTNFSGAQEGTHAITWDPGTYHCKKATFAGSTTTATGNDLSITPKYEECTLTSIFGNITISINMNGCIYTFTTSGETHLVCPAGKEISAAGPGCSLTIPGGQTLSGTTFTNIGSGTTREILLHTDITGKIKYSYSGFTCGSGSGTTNGSYAGTTKMTGTNSAGAHVGIWHQI